MEKGDFIRIDYVGRIKDTREIFDLTNEEVAKNEKIFNPDVKYKPVPIIVGEKFVIKGLDEELLKMSVGEKKIITVEPENAFGERNPKLVKVFPVAFFKKQKINPASGLIVNMSGVKGRVQSCNSGWVRVDFNNPLAGKSIEYEVEVKEKIDNQTEQIKSLFEFFGMDVKVDIKDNIAEIEMKKSIPNQLKEKISSLITKYVKGCEKVKFIEVY